MNPQGWSRWRHKPNTNDWLCSKCYDRLIHIPEFHKKWGNYFNKRMVKFGDKRVYVKGESEPRTGICSICKRSIHKGEIDRTALHHFNYDSDNPLDNTIELCFNCHADQHTHTRQRNKKGQFI